MGNHKNIQKIFTCITTINKFNGIKIYEQSNHRNKKADKSIEQ